jgi:hypothetical protein
VPLDAVLGKGFALIERNDGLLPLAAPRGDRKLDARLVRIVPRDHRLVDPPVDGVELVRDMTGKIAETFERANVRGVVLRPDRYVAACLARDSAPSATDELLDALAAGR